MADDVAFFSPIGGMNGAGDAARLAQTQYRRASNVCLVDGLPTTRPRVRVLPFQSHGTVAGDFVRVNNFQGARFFNPSKGQGGLVLGKDQSQVVFANGGRKFSLVLDGTSVNTAAKVTDISGGYLASSLLLLVWWATAENYAIATDGLANTFIYDANTGPSLSTGYDSVNKEESQFPNGATVTTYAHSRLVTVVNGRQVLVGDSLFKVDESSAVNLKGFTEQTYWNTGQFFLPPTSMGEITAIEILPIQDAMHGHGSTIGHCRDGAFSLDINLAPRSRWSSEAICKPLLSDSGAAGPYAVGSWSGDQIFRSRYGVSTLRSARATPDFEGNPRSPISEPIDCFFAADVEEWLRFASVAVWKTGRRALFTVDPCVDGRFRWHRGIVVRNFAPAPAERSPACWEGLWTLPPQASGVIQLVTGEFQKERLLAFVRGNDAVNRLVEFTDDILDDLLEDGTRQPVRCQIVTREMDMAQPFKHKEYRYGVLYPKQVRGRVEWGVWVRMRGRSKLIFWAGGVIDVAETTGPDEMQESEPFGEPVSLGVFPKECANGLAMGLSMQFVIRWKGYMQLESLRVVYGNGDGAEDSFRPQDLRIYKANPIADDYDDYEYSGSEEWTITPTP